jgi:hypothetical protein
MSNGYPRGCVMARGIAIVRCANCRLDSEHPSAATCRSMSLARVLRAERDPVHERQRATVPLSIEASTALSAAPSATAASESVDRPAPALAGVPAVAPLPATAPAPAPPELEPAARCRPAARARTRRSAGTPALLRAARSRNQLQREEDENGGEAFRRPFLVYHALAARPLGCRFVVWGPAPNHPAELVQDGCPVREAGVPTVHRRGTGSDTAC